MPPPPPRGGGGISAETREAKRQKIPKKRPVLDDAVRCRFWDGTEITWEVGKVVEEYSCGIMVHFKHRHDSFKRTFINLFKMSEDAWEVLTPPS